MNSNSVLVLRAVNRAQMTQQKVYSHSNFINCAGKTWFDVLIFKFLE